MLSEELQSQCIFLEVENNVEEMDSVRRLEDRETRTGY